MTYKSTGDITVTTAILVVCSQSDIKDGGKETHVWHKTKIFPIHKQMQKLSFWTSLLQNHLFKSSVTVSRHKTQPKRIDNITFTRILVYVWTPEKWTVTAVKGSPYKNHIEQCIIRS